MSPTPVPTVGYGGFGQPCQGCGHPEAAHLDMDDKGPTGRYRACQAEGCTCTRWITPWPKP